MPDNPNDIFTIQIVNIQKTLERIENKVELQLVTKDKFDGLEKRVVGVEESIRWVARSIGGIVISAVLGLALISK